MHFRKNISFFYYLSKCENGDEKILNEEESIEILKILGVLKNIQFL